MCDDAAQQGDEVAGLACPDGGAGQLHSVAVAAPYFRWASPEAHGTRWEDPGASTTGRSSSKA